MFVIYINIVNENSTCRSRDVHAIVCTLGHHAYAVAAANYSGELCQYGAHTCIAKKSNSEPSTGLTAQCGAWRKVTLFVLILLEWYFSQN